MRVQILILCLMCISFQTAFAHEPDEAFFKIFQKQSTVEVEAEFPWTMRNALLQFRPELEQSTSKADFEKVFVEYVQQYLILINDENEKLKFLEFQEVAHQGHSHQNTYRLVYSGSNIKEVHNSMMFAVNDNQVNHHSITIDAKTQTFNTDRVNPTFVLASDDSFLQYVWLLLILPLVYYLLKVKK